MIDGKEQKSNVFGLFRVGFVRQHKGWIKELAAFLGRSPTDISYKKISSIVEAQIETAETYRDFDRNIVAKDNAIYRLFDTGERKNGKVVYARFERNQTDADHPWSGVDFELGETAGKTLPIEVPIHIGDLGYLENYETWENELKNLTGNKGLDIGVVEKHIISQKKNTDIYKLSDGTSATEETADIMVFRTGCCFADTGKPIMARFWRAKNKFTWNGVEFVSEDGIPVSREKIRNHDSLFCAAFMPEGWEEELKRLAKPEEWTIDESKPNNILTQYLRLTYFRLRQQGKLFEKPDVCMIFNTGLVDRAYNDIHAYFAPNMRGACKWVLEGFGIIKGCGKIDRKICNYIAADLDRAKWFDRIEDLIFDIDKNVTARAEHCMVENALRLPLSVFEYALSDKNEFDDFISFMESLRAQSDSNHDDVQKKCYRKITSYSDYDEIRRRLQEKLDNAIGLVRKKASVDYLTAVPIYYPGKGRFSMLLPLSFGKPDDVHCALVVEQNESRDYVGVTILTPEMAYADARLLRKPDAQWLVAMMKERNIEGSYEQNATGNQQREVIEPANQPIRVMGRVVNINRDRFFGFIKSDYGHSVYFSQKQNSDVFDELSIGVRVFFDCTKNDKGYIASNIVIDDEDSASKSSSDYSSPDACNRLRSKPQYLDDYIEDTRW